ncbi:CreA family protein [Acidocella sp.]|uniref:CreA family protein n=1 Tax=Acidocella sp. TaxID=50710 RepID=UPI00261884C1|nr:CreA family protein [Acidocella sp.]MDD2794817.1 CreA family protein [Acidocella sp.]
MKRLFAALLLCLAGTAAHAEQTIGSVSTNFRLLGPNDKVMVERFDDPKVANVSCYASFAQTGGVAGGFGVATDPSEFALSCVAHGPVHIPADLPQKEEMGAISASFLFKHFIITRMVDTQDNTLVYVLISTKIIHGSPANALSAVPASN